MHTKGWIGVDLDGTLAEYHGWGDGTIGVPIPAMVDRIKRWLAGGIEVRIVTARVSDGPGRSADIQRLLIEQWCETNIGQKLLVTNCKDFAMVELWDDRAVQVIPNTGKRVDGNE